MGIKERIRRLERAIRETILFPGNEDGFITALGVNEKDFETPDGGYDFLSALNATAAEDWGEYGQ